MGGTLYRSYLKPLQETWFVLDGTEENNGNDDYGRPANQSNTKKHLKAKEHAAHYQMTANWQQPFLTTCIATLLAEHMIPVGSRFSHHLQRDRFSRKVTRYQKTLLFPQRELMRR
jgi:hypothetical protein